MTPVLRDLHWLPIVKRCQYTILVFTYNVLHQNASQYICEMVSWYHPNRQLRSANTTSLVPHRHKSILHGRRLMDTGATVLQLQYYGIICQTTLNAHRPYSYLKDF